MTPSDLPDDPRRVLSGAEVESAKPPGWHSDDGRLWRELEFATYRGGVDFALRVAELAEAQDHHPDVLIGYRRVRVGYVSHDAGGITARDLRAARAVNALLDGDQTGG